MAVALPRSPPQAHILLALAPHPHPRTAPALAGPGMQPTQERIWHPTPSSAASSKTTLVNIFPREHVVIPTATVPPPEAVKIADVYGFLSCPWKPPPGTSRHSWPQNKTRTRSQREAPQQRCAGGRWETGSKLCERRPVIFPGNDRFPPAGS